MTKAEAEKFARQCLYNYRENAARFAQKQDKYEIARLKGSRTEQNLSDGRKVVTYIDSTPWWIEEIELLEWEIADLRLRALPIERLLKDLEETKSEMLVMYKLKYEQRLPWSKARECASEEYSIGWRVFNRCGQELLETAIRYLDLRIDTPCTENGTGNGVEMVLESKKTA